METYACNRRNRRKTFQKFSRPLFYANFRREISWCPPFLLNIPASHRTEANSPHHLPVPSRGRFAFPRAQFGLCGASMLSNGGSRAWARRGAVRRGEVSEVSWCSGESKTPVLVGLRDGEYTQGRCLPLHWSGVRLCDAGGTVCVYVGGARTWDVTRLGDHRDMLFLHLGSMRSYVSDCLCVRLRGFSTLLYLAFAQGPGCGAGGKKR